MKQKRREHFCSPDFTIDNVGPLFPASWACSIDLECQESEAALVPLAFDGGATGLQDVLKSADLVFDQRVEDGTRFVVYRLGRLEVRALQEFGEESLVIG